MVRLHVPSGRTAPGATTPVTDIEYAVAMARLEERVRIADVIQCYPLDHFCYDTNNQGELLRLRDTLSEAIRKNVPAGEMIR